MMYAIHFIHYTPSDDIGREVLVTYDSMDVPLDPTSCLNKSSEFASNVITPYENDGFELQAIYELDQLPISGGTSLPDNSEFLKS